MSDPVDDRLDDRTAVIYVPFNAAGLPGGVARMPRVIRDAGLEHRLPNPVATWVGVDGITTARGPSGLLSESALTSMIVDTAAALSTAWKARTPPLVVAGDCPVLVAPLIAALQEGGAGLVFIDGHEDAWDPYRTSGEASDCEIGLALGLYPGPDALAPQLPCVKREQLIVLGPRDQAELAEAEQPSVRGLVAHYISGAELVAVSEPAQYRDVVDHIRDSAATAPAGWWCHVDLDVLDTASLPAVDYPQPGGLSWAQLERLTATCLSVPGCLGASCVIYNPDLDAGRNAPRIADYLAFIRGLLPRRR
ncbi:arginase family protein [Mycobacterium decipiens]|uniref:Arginase n=1 Tax=Mycobacterium decipiens TaxID=1430326 RepID=A0A1X2LPH2_9MYCO|nr:arginase family protein [Mycobacterium decipiens]OSC37230.1 hypothetical protein B8W66_21840 [Mycobacterium decipiens]